MSSKRRHASRNSSHVSQPHLHEDESMQDMMDEFQEVEPSPEPQPMPRQAAYDADRIGDILRRVREHRGEDLEDISEYLRIRPNYLFALENSRYEDLPADAYVIGFLRTYANYLDLDGKGAIDQYRREMMGRRRKPQLSMPQPMSEGRAPTVAIIVAAALAALIIYGIWYGLSSPDKEAMRAPIPLPEATQTPVQPMPAPAESTAAAAPQPQANAQETPAGTTLTQQTATTDGIALSVPATAVPPSTATTTPTTEPEEALPAKTNEPATPPAPTAKDKLKDAQPDKKSDATTGSSAPTQKAENPTNQETPPVSLTPTKQEQAAVYGDKKSKSHLMIKAEKESWVLVTDAKGNTVFDRTLKPGETYYVPAQKGLRLTTGNANGISFTYNDKALPKLQNDSPVVRAMSLDAEKLKNRLDGDSTDDSDTTDQ